jgi:REP element-mobilizing transposase RayT
MSRRPRKHHIQEQLPFPKRGGKRKGAGRPKKGFRASERHKKREALPARCPVEITLRVEREVGSLRKYDAYHAIRRALPSTFRRADFRICQITLQRDHVHLIAEASDERALARGMQGFEIAAAHQLNAAMSKKHGRVRRGRVFTDRYHARILRTPTEVKRALNYVLNNWRHHGEHRGIDSMYWDVDYFSSGPAFTRWKEPLPDPPTTTYQPLPVRPPSTWLLSVGWTRAGELSMFATPGRDCYE